MIQTKDSQGQTTVWSAGLNGQIVGWDPVTLTAKKELQVKLDQRNGKTLYSIAEVGDTFWCATRFNVVVINYNGDDNEAKTLTPKEGEQMSVDTMCAVSEKEVWTGCDKKGLVVIWSTKTYKNKHHTVCECNGFTCMLKVDDRVWAGSKNGNIYVIGVKQFKVIMELSLHQDRVRSMCLTDEGFVVSGPGSRDGRIAVWKSHLFEECSNVQHSSHERSKFPQQIMEEISTCGEEGGFALVCKKKTVKVDVDCNKIRDKPSRPTNKR
ncbi:DENN domain-containing protein 3-like [Stylophora pistillata]|uniref:DENN domain-containing protein 3-like n=1 Tax=Stylophora pistillata TaxID=50429 RepID=UPI000C03F9E2|nr:DENN domain-containing protein 3-like [Stylophora pistillata]